MTPAALLAAGLLLPAPPAVARDAPPAAAYAPTPLVELPAPAPWWDRLRVPPPDLAEVPGFDVAALLPPSLRDERTDPAAIGPAERLPPADAGGPAAWVTRTSLLSAATKTRGRLRADVWTDFDDTRRLGGQVLTTTWVKNLGLDAEANYWTQSRDPFPGDRLGGDWWTGDLNVVLKVADHPRGRLRTGGGAAWIVRDDGEAEAGYNGTIACDFGLLSHAVAGFEVDYGRIGDDELFRWRVGGGWAFKWMQLRAGYDDYRLGSEDRAGCFAGVVMRY